MRVNIWNGPAGPEDADWPYFTLDSSAIDVPEFTAEAILAVLQERNWNFDVPEQLFFATRATHSGMNGGLLLSWLPAKMEPVT